MKKYGQTMPGKITSAGRRRIKKPKRKTGSSTIWKAGGYIAHCRGHYGDK
ncbi:hypothetical protein [Acetatifactor muris]|nr:hypothetical protein [Acetatifactor muris]